MTERTAKKVRFKHVKKVVSELKLFSPGLCMDTQVPPRRPDQPTKPCMVDCFRHDYLQSRCQGGGLCHLDRPSLPSTKFISKQLHEGRARTSQSCRHQSCSAPPEYTFKPRKFVRRGLRGQLALARSRKAEDEMLELLATPHHDMRTNGDLKIYEPLNLELSKVAFPGSLKPKARTVERKTKQRSESAARSYNQGDTTERTKVNMSIQIELQLLE